MWCSYACMDQCAIAFMVGGMLNWITPLLCSLGAGTVKYTTPLPCTFLSVSDSRLHPNFEFCEGKNYRHFEKHIDLQSQTIYVENLFTRGV